MEKGMKYYLRVFLSSVFAGLLICLGALGYLCSKQASPIGGALIFGFGLFVILVKKLHLFTGKVGFIFDNKPSYLLDLAVCLVGNFVAAAAVGLSLFALTDGVWDLSSLMVTARVVASSKLSLGAGTTLVLSMLCGVMIFLAVHLFNKDVAPLFKVVSVFVAVAIFILCGFEHCVANMFYFCLAGELSAKAFGYLAVMIVGNSIGSLAVYWLDKGITILTPKGE